MLNVNLVLTLVLVAAVAWLINSRESGMAQATVGLRTIVNVALGLIVVGVLLWLVNTYVPMAGSIRAILNIVVVIATIAKVLQVFGLWGEIASAWNGLVHRPPRPSGQ